MAACLQHEEWRFVYRTDIRGYYRHIRKQQVLSQINWRVQSPILRDLLKQYLYYSVEDGGEIHTPITGISRGCALSPMIGASLLHHVDSYFASREEIFYVRYMDDFLLFTRTRWSLRRMVKQLATFFDLGGFSTHPDKTQVGKIEHGFDWLGLWFGTEGPTIAPRALENHRARRVRLYEQARRKRLSATETDVLVQAYEARWNTWAEGMLAAALPSRAASRRNTRNGPWYGWRIVCLFEKIGLTAEGITNDGQCNAPRYAVYAAHRRYPTVEL